MYTIQILYVIVIYITLYGDYMKKHLFIVTSLAFALTTLSAQAGDDNWFKAQTKVAPVQSITSTSELVEAQFDGKYLYPPINIIDGDLSTTWCEDEKNGPGIGESITIEFSEPVSFDEIQFVNGFATKDYYLKNNRVKKVQITQVAKKHFQQKSYVLKDNCETYQSIKFPLLQTAQTITLKIEDVYKGNKYDDTCLDEFRIMYKGKQIPFTNVAQLKTIQNENSKQMLNSSAASFETKFKALFKNTKLNVPDHYDITYSPILILVADNKKDAIYLDLYNNKLSRFVKCTLMQKPAKYENVRNLNDEQAPMFTKEQYESSNATYFLNVPDSNLSWRDSQSHRLGNYRIITETTISYVTTTTTAIIKLDGNSVYVNGVKYNITNTNDIFIGTYYREGM